MTRPEPSYNPGAVARALTAALITSSEADRIGEPANITDGLFAIARALDRLADRIGPHPPTDDPAEGR